ncbi:uncharacterized protein LOC129586815 [Paramacrobiotus metropolitanus]|uniref:uncharacterized protein LOC129586815 n=1 Tax=Paramacrobiotus metropolitanus TaxID=2943436 RepID=UPI002445FE2A|nr:uncharacterized protein LOC129586815 [Paramacrobiotus metropolitanus]
MERHAAQLVIKWLEFSIPNLSEYPPEYQVLINNISKLLAVEIVAISLKDPLDSPVTPVSPLSPANLWKPLINSHISAVKRENEQHKKLNKILNLLYLGSDIEQTTPFPGIGRFIVVADDQRRSIQYACLTKALTPEHVRNFFTEGIIKRHCDSGILLSSNGVSDAKRFDIFGITDTNDNQIPVVFLSNFPKDAKRMENLMELAEEILAFLSKPEISDSKKFTLMPKLLHSLSDLIGFMEFKKGILQDISKESVKLPEYLSYISGMHSSVSSRSTHSSVRSIGSGSVSASSKPTTQRSTTTTTTSARPAFVRATGTTTSTARASVRPTSRTVETVPLSRGRSAERILIKQVSAGPVVATKTTTTTATIKTTGRDPKTTAATLTSKSTVSDPKKFRSLAARGPASSKQIQREIENYCAIHGYDAV